jgi:catalase
MIKTLCKNENSESVGVRSALLLQDYILHEKMAHFNREGIPESGIQKIWALWDIYRTTTSANILRPRFSEIGKETKVLVRFSTVGGEKGSADTERAQGFCNKFHTKMGMGSCG